MTRTLDQLHRSYPTLDAEIRRGSKRAITIAFETLKTAHNEIEDYMLGALIMSWAEKIFLKSLA